MTPTKHQLRCLEDLNRQAGRYIRDRFDLGGCELRDADGNYPREHYSTMFLKGPTVEACHRRGWLAYTIHRWGENEVEIERRYTITDAGRAVLAAQKQQL